MVNQVEDVLTEIYADKLKWASATT
jgi:hypothetical protein